MSRKAVLIALVFLVSTLGLLVAPAAAQPVWRVYGWGAVTGYMDVSGAYDVSGGFFFSVRGDKWMMWAYYRHPVTNELVYITLDELLLVYGINEGGVMFTAAWDMYVDWVYTGTFEGTFLCYYWREWVTVFGDFYLYGSFMFSRVRPYYMIL